MGRRRKKTEDHPDDTFGHFGTHECKFPNCGTQIAAHRAFCVPHWDKLSPTQRNKLADAYADWQTGKLGTLERLREVQAECVRLLQQMEK